MIPTTHNMFPTSVLEIPMVFQVRKLTRANHGLGGWLINWKILILALVVLAHPWKDPVGERGSPLTLGSWGFVLSGWKAAWVPQSMGFSDQSQEQFWRKAIFCSRGFQV